MPVGSIVIIAYALAMILCGVTAFLLAPEGAKAITALIIPGVCALVMLGLALVEARAARSGVGLARRAHLAAVILTLVFGGAFSWRAAKTNLASMKHQQAATEFARMVESGAAQNTPEERRQYFAAQGAADHDKTYLANTLWVLTAISAAAFIALLTTRPRGPEAGPAAAPPQ